MIINGFESGFLRPFYGLLLRCRRRPGCVLMGACHMLSLSGHLLPSDLHAGTAHRPMSLLTQTVQSPC